MKTPWTSLLAALLITSAATGCAAPAASPEPRDMPPSLSAEADRQRLLALRFDGYEEMTVSAFQNRVWALTDTKEAMDLLERLSKSETPAALKDTDEAAAFLRYVLEPLTAERWTSRTYGGAATSGFPQPEDNAMVEYDVTLTILDPGSLTVREYNEARLAAMRGMDGVLRGKTEDDLRDEASTLAGIQAAADALVRRLQSDKLGISIEYAYFPLPPRENDAESERLRKDSEPRRSPSGTEADYRSLLALKTPGYEALPLADFNRALLAWADEDHARMERIECDMARDDFHVPLAGEERSFVTLTTFLSGMENGKYVQSVYTGRGMEAPVYAESLPQRAIEEAGTAAWCSLSYRFSYSIADPQTVTVGERDTRIDNMIHAVRAFWNDMDLETLLRMDEKAVVTELQKIAAAHSTEDILLSVEDEQVHFERMDERPCAR